MKTPVKTKKATTKKTAAKKSATKKTAVKKTVAKKTAVRKIAAKKTTVKKSTTKRATAKKSTVKKADSADPTVEILKKCYTALDDKKADNIKILDVRGKSPITNYFIIATATSEPHLKALSNEIEKTLKDLGVKSVGRDYNTQSGWVVVDGFDFMAHMFLPEQRGLYGIESLWKDADEISF